MARKNPIPNSKPFPKGVSGNPNGRPKKHYNAIIDEIKAKGYQAPTRTEYFDLVSLLLVMTEQDLQDFAKNSDRPYWVRILILELSNKGTRQRMMESYRDWLFGKAEQKHEIEVSEKPIFLGIDLSVKED